MNKTELKKSLDIAVEALQENLSLIRTGRATPAILDNIRLEAYGAKMTIKEVGNVTVSDASTLVITPWDKGLLNPIAKAIRESDLKIEPIMEGDRVRLVFPGLTEERRKEFAKLVSEKVEECRQRVRKVRQDVMRQIDTQFDNKEIGEDEKFSLKEDVEELVREYNEEIENIGDKKTDEIMTV
ncbi:ribosome recycling factor [Patescibacteria group bacterium]|nr:ribosome recycling factor [Patescibacteria group bacterium]